MASDIGIDEMYVAPSSLKTQDNLNQIGDWTELNYMVFSRSETEFATRLAINGNTIDRIEEIKLTGVWLTTWLDWDKNT